MNAHTLVLAIHPSSSGFGWVLFEAPLVPIDWGVVAVSGDKNADGLAKFEQLLALHNPEALALEQFEGVGVRRSSRIRAFCRSLIVTARMHNVPVRVISRQTIEACFPTRHPTTRHEIAQAVAGHLHEFAHRLPPPRRAWDSERPVLALFSAAALGIAWYAHPEASGLSGDTPLAA